MGYVFYLSTGEKIPPKSTLIFEVELLDVQDGPKPENIFKKIDTDEDNKLSREEVRPLLLIPGSSDSSGSQVSGDMVE